MTGYEKALPALKALCDETRLSILSMLSGGEKCACRIQDAFECSQPTISYHMRVLVESGLVTARREGALIYYTLDEKAWPCAQTFLNSLSTLNAGEEESCS